MKTLILRSFPLVALVVAVPAMAADLPVKAPLPDHGSWWIGPSVTAGYASFGDVDISLQTNGVAIAGLDNTRWRLPNRSGHFIDGELPIALTDRLKLTFGGRWMSSTSTNDTHEIVNDNSAFTAVRLWNTDRQEWATAQALLSYALVKDVGSVKEIDPYIGFRWDRHKIYSRNPLVVVGAVANAVSDTADFEMTTHSWVLGIAATFEGHRSSNFGGPIKFGVEYSPAIRGDVDYKETFANPAFLFQFGGRLSDSSYFSANAETTLLSGKLAARARGKLALVGQYTRFVTRGTLLGSRVVGGAVIAQENYQFSASPYVTTIGLKATVVLGGR
jgi:hypothetical protein